MLAGFARACSFPAVGHGPKLSRHFRPVMKSSWVEISAADYLFLTSSRATMVAFAYRSALKDAPDFYFDSARTQLEIFQNLGVLTENTGAALAVFKVTYQSTGRPARANATAGPTRSRHGVRPKRSTAIA